MLQLTVHEHVEEDKDRLITSHSNEHLKHQVFDNTLSLKETSNVFDITLESQFKQESPKNHNNDSSINFDD